MPEPQLRWTTQRPDEASLSAGYERVLRFEDVVSAWARVEDRPAERAGERDPGAAFLGPLLASRGVAVLDVELTDLRALVALHRLVLRPLLHHGTRLLVHATTAVDDLDDGDFTEPWYEHAFTLERVRWLVRRATEGSAAAHRGEPVPASDRLDPEQAQAAGAPGGVLQILAPAGSGKTTTLLRRARVLIERGVPAERILICTFNKDAQLDIQARAAALGIRVDARTFNSVGRDLMAGLFDARPIVHGFTVPQWGRFSRSAARGSGELLDDAELPAAVDDLKLGRLLTPQEARTAARDDRERHVAEVYGLVEAEVEASGGTQFSDQIFLPVRRLREDPAFRRRAQDRYDAVLVDEYQDIEPAQQLLVSLLAAPHDELTVVGDDDQTLYEWRRASVDTMLGFDRAFPGLTRVALRTNYRCAPEQVAAAAALIGHNRRRFAKDIVAAPGRAAGGPAAVRVAAFEEDAAAPLVARKLAGATRGDLAVLSRTVNGLRPYAVACAAAGVAIDGPDELFRSSGALRTVEAYMDVFADPPAASEEDLAQVMRRPQRGMSDPQSVRDLVAALRDGATFVAAVERIGADGHPVWQVRRAKAELGRLARSRDDASAFLRALREDRFDEYVATATQAAASPDRADRDLLDRCEQEARGMDVAAYARVLRERSHALERARDREHGVELTTVHRAKGREWRRVVVVSFDEGHLPHRQALEEADGLESERRVAYVAMTRAAEELSLLHDASRPSRFLVEARLLEAPPPPDPAATVAGGPPSPAPGGAEADALRELESVGAKYSLRNRPTRASALRWAAYLLRNRGVLRRAAAGQDITVGLLIGSLDEARPADREALTELARSAGAEEREVRALDGDVAARLAAAARALLGEATGASGPSAAGGQDGVDPAHLARLKEWRRERADGKPAYTIANDDTLAGILQARPRTKDELLPIRGIGPAFVDRHADSLFEVLAELFGPGS